MYTEEQKREALRVLDECNGRVTAAMRKLGYPSRQCFYQWINERDAAHVRKNGRPFSHYSEQTKDDAIRLLNSGMGAKDIADHLGVLNAAIVHNWARAAKRKADCMDNGRIERRSIECDGRAYDGFDDGLEEKVRQLELENDILRGVVDVSKGASLGSLTNREKTILVEHLRQATGRRLSELTAFLRISKSSYEYQRAAIAKGGKYASIRPLVVEAFEASSKTRGYRYITHELRGLDEPIVVSGHPRDGTARGLGSQGRGRDRRLGIDEAQGGRQGGVRRLRRDAHVLRDAPRALAAHPHEQRDRAPEQGDQEKDPRRRHVPRRKVRPDAGDRPPEVRRRQRMGVPPLPGRAASHHQVEPSAPPLRRHGH